MLELQDKKLISTTNSKSFLFSFLIFVHILNLLTILSVFNTNRAIAQVYQSTYQINSVGNEFLSNRFTRPEIYTLVKSPYTTVNHRKFTESKKLELWFDEKTTSLRIIDKRSGYIWGDVNISTDAYNEMNETWKNIAISAVMVEYFDERGISNVVGSADPSVKREVSNRPNGISLKLNFTELKINFTVDIYLEDDKIVFAVPNKSIKETGNYKLASLVFAPFLGSVPGSEINGYIFVPDGPGALIRFSKPAHYLNWFEKRVYGKDYSIENLASVNDLRSRRSNDFLREEPSVLMPVFGIVHGVKQNAFLGVVTSGMEYTAIISYPSGILSMFNWASAKFIYRQKYLQPTSRSGAGIQVAQEKMNKFDACLEISFLTGKDADYVGMARYYRDHYLLKILGKESKTNTIKARVDHNTNSNVPIILTIIASDIEKQVLGHRRLPITKVSEMKDIVSELNKMGVKNVSILVEGWQEGGVHGNKVNSFKLENKIGSIRDLLDFVKYSQNIGYKVFFVDNVTKTTEKQINLKRDVGINLSQSIIYEDRDNRDIWLYRSYFVNINLASNYLLKRAEKIKELGITNIAIREYGNKLYGELKFNKELYRSDALKLVEMTLEKISKNVDNLYLESPNDYTWKFVDGIWETPMNCSQYLFETDTVPFLQIVLSGTIDYFAPYMNNSFFSRNDVLKTIEYGAYPAFIISKLDNYLLKKTPLFDYSSTKYEDWRKYIVETYKEINLALRNVRNSRILDRIIIEPGVVIVVYDNGRGIIVNYKDSSYKIYDYTIKPKSWINILVDEKFLRQIESLLNNNSNVLTGVDEK